MFSTKFLSDLAERAISTAAQAFLAAIGSAALFDAVNADWRYLGSVTAGGAILSVAKSLVARGVGDPDSASLTR